MVHWDQAWKICVTLIDKMEVQWLQAKTEKGQPPHRTALHMMACNSDRAVRKPELVVLLANPPELTLWVVVGYILLAMSAVLTLWASLFASSSARPPICVWPLPIDSSRR